MGAASYVLTIRDFVEEIDQYTTVRASIALRSVCTATAACSQPSHVCKAACDYYFGMCIVSEQVLRQWGLDIRDFREKLPRSMFLNPTESIKMFGWYCETNRHVSTLKLYEALDTVEGQWRLFYTPCYIQYTTQLNQFVPYYTTVTILNSEQKLELKNAMRRCKSLYKNRVVDAEETLIEI